MPVSGFSRSLANIAKQIDQEHSQIMARGPEQLGHAIRCGELLIEAQKSVPRGEWVGWLNENVSVFRTTAFKYMRIARNKERVIDAGITGIDPAIEFLQGERRLTHEEKDEILVLRKQGKTMEEIGKLFGIKKSTVSYHVNQKDRDKTKRMQRQRRAAERRAFERQAQERSVKRDASQPVAEAYSLVRRAAQRLSQRLEQDLEFSERRHISTALDFCFKVEDEIGASIRGA